MRRLCAPKTAATDAEFVTTAASKPPDLSHPPWPLMVPGTNDGGSKSVPIVSAPAAAGIASRASAAIAAPVVQ